MVLNVRRRRDFRRCKKIGVLFNGVDVTTRCFYADGRRGVVRLYRLNADGKKFTEPILNAPHWDVPRRLAVEELRGRVQWQAR